MSASENSTDDADDIENLIKENENIQLDEKTYNIISENENSAKHVLINKSLTIEGIEGKTVIDGNNNTLYLDCKEPEKENVTLIFVGNKDGYNVKNTGENILFKGIIFKDINIVTWHNMTFMNCKFINTNYTSCELDDSFNNCLFDNTKIKPYVLIGNKNLNKRLTINECNFYNSVIKSLSIMTSTYIHMVGGDQFRIINYVDVTDSKLFNSKIDLTYTNMTAVKSEFNTVDFTCYSSIINLNDCKLKNPNITLKMSQINSVESDINNSNITASAGYFSKGCEIHLKDSLLNNTQIAMVPNSISSRPSEFSSVDSKIENADINLTDTRVSIEGNDLIKTHLLLFFSSMNMKNSTFYNEGNIKDLIKTKNTSEKYLFDKDMIKSIPCVVKTNYTVQNSYLVNSTGVYSIENKDVGVNTLHKLIVSNKKSFYYGDSIIINLKDYKGNALANQIIYIEDLNTYDTYKVKTDKKGVAKFKLKNTGKKSFYIYYTSPGFTYRDIDYGLTVKFTVNKIKAAVKAPKVTAKFKKSKYFKVTVKNKATKKAVPGVKVKIKVYTGKKYKIYTKKTDKNGIVKLNTKSLKIGKHKIVISSGNKNVKITAKSQIKIKK